MYNAVTYSGSKLNNSVKAYNKSLYVFVYLIYSFLVLLFGFAINDNLSLKFFGIFVTLHLLLSVSFIIKFRSKKSVISLCIVFFLYIFNLGQLFLKTFFTGYAFTKLDLLEVYGLEAFAQSSVYSVLIITFIVTGILLCSERGAHKSVVNLAKNQLNKKGMITLGSIIVVTAAIANLIILSQQLAVASIGAYETASSVQGSGLLSLYSNFLLLGVCILMLANSQKKSVVNAIYFFTIIFYALMMVTGQRGKYVIIILAVSVLYFKINGITFLKGLVSVVIIYLGLAILNLISLVRDEEIITFGVIFNNIQNIRYPLLSCIEEFGASQYTLELTMSNIPQFTDFLYGYSYIVNWIRVLPNVNGAFTNIINSSVYYVSFHTQSMGGSVIGEFYANFGWFGFIAAFIYGYFIGSLSNRFELSLINKNDLRIPVYLFAFAFIMWWIRDSVGTLANVVWAFIFIRFLTIIFRSLYHK